MMIIAIFVVMWLFNAITLSQRVKDIVNGVVMVLVLIFFVLMPIFQGGGAALTKP